MKIDTQLDQVLAASNDPLVLELARQLKRSREALKAIESMDQGSDEWEAASAADNMQAIAKGALDTELHI